MLLSLSSAELPILMWFQSLRNPLCSAIAVPLGAAAAHGELFIVLTLLLLLYKPTRKVGLVCATSLLLDLLTVNILIKPCVARIRPYDLSAALTALGALQHDFSFPSGHTAVAFAFAAPISLLGQKAHLSALTLAAIVGLSRLYLGVHYPTDVLAGAVIGTCCGLFALLLWKKAFKRDMI